MSNPIRVLEGNIINTFENINDISLKNIKKASELKNISGKIVINRGNCGIKTPKAGLKSRDIILQETYLSHLWSYIYSMLVIFQEGYQRPLKDGTFKGCIEYKTPLMKRAKNLFDWSISLKKSYSNWDLNLPNPKTNNFTEEEQNYILKTNNIYQHAVTFLLYHEYCHLTQGHDSYDFSSKVKNRDEFVCLENEADYYAYNMMVDDSMSTNEKTLMSISIFLVMSSSLFITATKFEIKQPFHPDLDIRLVNLLRNMNFDNDTEEEFYFYTLCNVNIIFFFNEYGIPYNGKKVFDTDKDQLSYLLDIIDKIKGC